MYMVLKTIKKGWKKKKKKKLQTRSALHSRGTATLRLSLLSKLLVSSKLLHLEYFVLYVLCTFGSAITL